MLKLLKAVKIKTLKSQSIYYKNMLLTVHWGGEHYTAAYNGDIYREMTLSQLKQSIANGECYNGCYDDDMEMMSWYIARDLEKMRESDLPLDAKVDIKDCVGNTLTAAAMEAFNKKNQRDIQLNDDFGFMTVRVRFAEVWVNYDHYVDGDIHRFLIAQ